MPDPYTTARTRFRAACAAAGIARPASDALLGIAGRLARLHEHPRYHSATLTFPCPHASVDWQSLCELCGGRDGHHEAVPHGTHLRAKLEQAAIAAAGDARLHFNGPALAITLAGETLTVPVRKG